MVQAMDKIKEQFTRMDTLIPLIQERLSAGQSIRFSPKGTSMLPMLREARDTVTLSPLSAQLKKYDLPLYRRENGQYVLHRIIRVTENCTQPAYTCMGDNQFTPEHGLKHDQMIALVTGFSRGGKEHSVEEHSYKLYCRLWYITCPARKLYRKIKRKLICIYRKLSTMRGKDYE